MSDRWMTPGRRAVADAAHVWHDDQVVPRELRALALNTARAKCAPESKPEALRWAQSSRRTVTDLTRFLERFGVEWRDA